MSQMAQELPKRHRYTASEYHTMGEAGIFGEDDRVELVQGEIIDMVPMGSRHAGIVKYLNSALTYAVSSSALLCVQDPIALDTHSEPQPDLALLRPRADYYQHSHPGAADVLLVIEVAERSLHYDGEIKLPLYAAHGIPQAWLVDVRNLCLTVHTEPTATNYANARRVLSLDEVALPESLTGSVDLSQLFVGAPDTR